MINPEFIRTLALIHEIRKPEIKEEMFQNDDHEGSILGDVPKSLLEIIFEASKEIPDDIIILSY